jgi:hypothetical protein
MTRLASGPVAPTTCGGTLPSAFKTPPALLALIDAQVIGRKRMPLSAAAWDTIQPDPAQIGSREGDDHAAFSVERAPASSGGVVRNAQHDNATVVLRRIVPDISPASAALLQSDGHALRSGHQERPPTRHRALTQLGDRER